MTGVSNPSGVPALLRVRALGVSAAPGAAGTVTATTITAATVTATNATVSGSAVCTQATHGRLACGRSSSLGALQAGSLNITSVSRTGVGTYVVNYTAASFTQVPAIACTLDSTGGVTGFLMYAGPTSTSMTVTIFNTSFVLTDAPFSFQLQGV